MPNELQREMPPRVVVLGDLNAQGELLRRYLLGLRLLRRNGSWCGGRTVLVQMGDFVNRGGQARMAMDLLIHARREARNAGGDVVCLLGNHEVMSALGNEGHVTPEEYLEFADPEDLMRFSLDRVRMGIALAGAASPERSRRIEPFAGRLRAWEEATAPGREAYRAAMSSSGTYGRFIRGLPVAVMFGQLVFVHGGLAPSWAGHGLSGLERLRREAWAAEPVFYQDLETRSTFRDTSGPLWHRAFAAADTKALREELRTSLRTLGGTQMFVGHTRTDTVPGGAMGRPLVRLGGRFIMTDTAMGEPAQVGAAVVIERGRAEVWTPGGSRSRLVDIKKR